MLDESDCKLRCLERFASCEPPNDLLDAQTMDNQLRKLKTDVKVSVYDLEPGENDENEDGATFKETERYRTERKKNDTENESQVGATETGSEGGRSADTDSPTQQLNDSMEKDGDGDMSIESDDESVEGEQGADSPRSGERFWHALFAAY